MLANRLLQVETNTLRLRADITRLQREAENDGGGGGGGWFEPSRARFPWRRAEDPDGSFTEFGPYDYRADDAVVDEGSRGRAFLARFGLEGDTPDFKAATDAQTALALKACGRLGYKSHFVPHDNWLFQDRYTTDLQEMGVECA
jgi:hypothetical protein